MTTIYGIPNCDTMKKARTWLSDHGVDYDFHDYKKEGVSQKHLKRWAAEVGWEKLLNRAGTTFRKLPPETKENINQAKAFALMAEQPSMIKRPVLEANGVVLVGFSAESYAQLFDAKA